jgi:hypothetical protein
MKRIFVVLAFLILTTFASPAEACEQCQSYFYYGCSCWCKYCAATYCGDFDCTVQDAYGVEFCTGEEGCFENGRGCEQEPPVALERLSETWELTRVRVFLPSKPDAMMKGGRAGA